MQRSQRDDLWRAAQEGLRLVTQQIIYLRNTGQIDEEFMRQFDKVVEEMRWKQRLEYQLDIFDPKVDVQGALDELYPIPSVLRAGGPGPRERAIIARLELAIKKLGGSTG